MWNPPQSRRPKHLIIFSFVMRRVQLSLDYFQKFHKPLYPPPDPLSNVHFVVAYQTLDKIQLNLHEQPPLVSNYVGNPFTVIHGCLPELGMKGRIGLNPDFQRECMILPSSLDT